MGLSHTLQTMKAVPSLPIFQINKNILWFEVYCLRCLRIGMPQSSEPFTRLSPQITHVSLGFVQKAWMDRERCGVRMCVCESETAANEVQLQVPGAEPRQALQRQRECVCLFFSPVSVTYCRFLVTKLAKIATPAHTSTKTQTRETLSQWTGFPFVRTPLKLNGFFFSLPPHRSAWTC